MSGFCGSCGSPRPYGHSFCGSCGFRFPPPVQTCPTCGQPWTGGPVIPSDTEAFVAPGVDAVGLPRGPDRGPDYDEDTDCGNCGFECPPSAETCPRCGSANTGLEFRASL